MDMRLRDVVFGKVGFMEWIKTEIWHPEALLELAVCIGAILLSYGMAKSICPWLERVSERRPVVQEWVKRRLPGLLTPFLSAVFLHVAMVLATKRGWPAAVIELSQHFVEAWLVIQVFATILFPPGWTKRVTMVVAGIFLLEVLGLLDPVLSYMDKLALTFQNNRVSALEILKAIVLLAVMLPLINKLCNLLESGLARVEEIKPRVLVLLSKLTKVALYTVAIFSAMDLVGINLQMLTVFSGAMGLGVGFGLQKVVSNLVSGVILLLDNSIKPGDVIEVSGVYGWVETMNARFACMLTRDGKSFLIPNDDLISGKVVNWSYTGPTVRLKVPVGIAYTANLKLAMVLMLKACENHERVLKSPDPTVLIKEFGDSGIVLELRLWTMNPEKGVSNLISDIQMAIWELFTQKGIELSSPQREVKVKEPVRVAVEHAKPGRTETD